MCLTDTGITETNSYSLVIRDVFHDALVADPFFAGYFTRKTKMVPVQHDQLPFLGVYIVSETMLPDGEADQTDIKFIHTLVVGFSVMVAINDQDAAEKQIDAAFWRINNRLLIDENQNIFNVWFPTNPDNTKIESVTRGVRRHVFGASQLNNQTPLAELQYDMSVNYRTMWDPVITDDLLEIDVTTGVKPGDTPEEMAQRKQVQAHYVFEAATKQAPKSRFAEFAALLDQQKGK
jgi:hypothetical protein